MLTSVFAELGKKLVDAGIRAIEIVNKAVVKIAVGTYEAKRSRFWLSEMDSCELWSLLGFIVSLARVQLHKKQRLSYRGHCSIICTMK